MGLNEIGDDITCIVMLCNLSIIIFIHLTIYNTNAINKRKLYKCKLYTSLFMYSCLMSTVERLFGAMALNSLSGCTLIKDRLHLQATHLDYSILRELAVGWNSL